MKPTLNPLRLKSFERPYITCTFEGSIKSSRLSKLMTDTKGFSSGVSGSKCPKVERA
jgi:hypothetical protein